MKLVKLGVVCGAFLLAACGGEDGATGAAGAQGPAGPAGADGSSGGGGAAGAESVNGITPSKGVAGRTIQVSISGDNSVWSDAAKPDVSFGAGVTVNEVIVASPTALLVNITLAADGEAGERDVKVGEQTFKGFQVVAPLTTTIEGEPLQGSLIFVDITNNDKIENPFDPAALNAGVFDGNEQADAVNSRVLAGANGSSATLLIATDVTAAAKTYDLVTLTGTTEANAVSSLAKGALVIGARAPVVMADGVKTAVTVASGGLHTQLFSYEKPAGGVATMPTVFSFVPATDADEQDAALVSVLLLPASGSFLDQLDGTSTGLAAGEKVYPILVSQGLTGNVAGSILARTLGGTAVNEGEPNETTATATVIASLPVNMSGGISDNGDDPEDVDVYSFAATSGTTYYIDVLPRSNGGLDPQITILDGAGAEIVTFDSNDGESESASFTATATGNYFVQIDGVPVFVIFPSTGFYSMYISAAP